MWWDCKDSKTDAELERLPKVFSHQQFQKPYDRSNLLDPELHAIGPATAQHATMCDMNLINLAAAWYFLSAQHTMKTQTVLQPMTYAKQGQCARTKHHQCAPSSHAATSTSEFYPRLSLVLQQQPNPESVYQCDLDHHFRAKTKDIAPWKAL